MNDFYTKSEASRILGISQRTLTNWLQAGKLRSVKQFGRTLIPEEDVDEICLGNKENLPPSRKEFKELESKLGRLEDQVESLKGALRFGAPRTRRSDADLLLLYSEHRKALKQQGWSKAQMLDVAQEAGSLREDELEFLFNEKGERGWMPTFQLLRLMRQSVEGSSEYPGGGLDVLHTRLDQAIQRFYSLVYMSAKTDTDFDRKHALQTLKSLQIRPGALDQFIARGIAREAAKNARN